ncbi:hypothetical protein FOZ60_015174 [Perkinsus olseni]|uniref:Uncharacterized protein n=1 Tax=Perkinsus olseni TaxID=32597 RepID=A0A7J6P671_PEROL|nr:hypothetical protein FOZ60_015174 [Perkinsus olseni]
MIQSKEYLFISPVVPSTTTLVVGPDSLTKVDASNASPRLPKGVEYARGDKGCSKDKKAKEEPFCVVGTFDFTDALKLSVTTYLFDLEDAPKSTSLHFDMAIKNSAPAGLNVTGGGCAKVADKKELDDIVEGAVVLCTETVGDGVGKYDPTTGDWSADLLVKAFVEAKAFGSDFITLPAISKVVTARMGPNYDFGVDASFEESTGDEDDKGMSIAFDLTMNNKDGSITTWELNGAAKFRVWWDPFFDKHPEAKLFSRVFDLKL